MGRTAALGVVVLAALAAATVLALRWPSSAPALDCGPAEIFLDDAGVARCGAGQALSAPQKLTVGQRLDLNAATAEELAAIPGLGRDVAAALVAERARLNCFARWDEVDAVSGVGAARLATLQSVAEIGVCDAGR